MVSIHSPEPHPTGRSAGRTPGHSLSPGRGPPPLHSKACCKWTTVVSSLVPSRGREKHEETQDPGLCPRRFQSQNIPLAISARRNKSVLPYSHPARLHFPQEKKGILYPSEPGKGESIPRKFPLPYPPHPQILISPPSLKNSPRPQSSSFPDWKGNVLHRWTCLYPAPTATT